MDTDRGSFAIRVVKSVRVTGTVRAAVAVLATAMAVCLLLLLAPTAKAVTPEDAFAAAEAYLVKTVTAPEAGSVGGEWTVIGLARARTAVPGGYWEGYLGRLHDLVAAQGAKLHSSRSTDNARVILALTSLGRDPTSFGGQDLVAPLADMDWVTRQGINGAIFALIAANSGGYSIPADGGVANQTTEAKLIGYILDRELNQGTPQVGGWALVGADVDPDITGMALQSLAPYYGQAGHADVTAAADRALARLSAVQLADGGFKPASFAGSEPCAESNAQVIIALTALGVDPTTDARFVKSGGDPMTALLGFAQVNGSFKHDASGSGESLMSTEQAMLALAAYDRLKDSRPALYDMSDAVEPATRIADIWAASHPVAPGVSVALPTRLEFTDGATGYVAWTSSAPNVATVGADGVLTGIAEGVTTLTATAADASGRTAQIAVTVAKAVTRLRTPLAKIYLVRGTRNWKPFVAADNVTNGKAGVAARLTFSSSKQSVATVSTATGKINALKIGTTTITARALNGKLLRITVTVTSRNAALRKFGLSGLSASLKAGGTALLKLKPGPAKATNLKPIFTSSNSRVATVDAAGKVTALRKGSVSITVKLSGKKLAKKLTVK